MRVAIVVPNHDQYPLEAIPQTGYHLLLAHEILRYPDAARMSVGSSSYVVVDNSAHEASNGLGVDHLVQAAEIVKADEIVLPDRLFFGDDTYQQSLEAYLELRSTSYSLMGVPQGRTPGEWETCLLNLLDLTTTIGISKDYEVWPSGLLELVTLAVDAGAETIHMLGWGREMSQVLDFRNIPQIRGIDSAKPLVYAKAGIPLPGPRAILAGVQTQYPGRRSVRDDSSDIDLNLVEWNIDVFRRICGDESIGGPSLLQLPFPADARESGSEHVLNPIVDSVRWGSTGPSGNSARDPLHRALWEASASDA